MAEDQNSLDASFQAESTPSKAGNADVARAFFRELFEMSRSQIVGAPNHLGRFSMLRSLLGQQVAIQEKGGPIITGLFAEFDPGEGYLKITNATIAGRARKTSPPFVLVHFSSISHIRPESETEKA